MYFFTRTARVRSGQMGPATSWAIDLTGRVNQITDLGLQLWGSILSPQTGTLAWSTFVGDLTTLNSANDKLATDPGFLDQSAQGGDLMAENTLDDITMHLIHTAGEPVSDPHFATIVTTAMLPGGYAKGAEVGVELAERAATLSGVATSFLIAATGPYGGCAWIAATETLEELDRGGRQVSLDADLVAYLDQHTVGVYRPESGIQTMWRRFA
jgi:hypothetical protein